MLAHRISAGIRPSGLRALAKPARTGRVRPGSRTGAVRALPGRPPGASRALFGDPDADFAAEEEEEEGELNKKNAHAVPLASARENAKSTIHRGLPTVAV